MDSVDQTLRKARQVQERFNLFMSKKAQQDKSFEQTFKKIDKAQQTLKETQETIGTIDKLYDRLQKVLSQSINAAVSAVEKNTLVSVAQPNFQPHYVTADAVGQMLKQKKKILVLTGAGISADSGIPTFRGEGGFWKSEKVEFDPDNPQAEIEPQIVLTNAFFHKHPEVTWKWLRNFLQLKVKAKPNKGHHALSSIIQHLSSKGKQLCIVTQNIDNFHNETKAQHLAKNKKVKDYPVYQIHGNILKVRCNHCTIKKKQLYYESFENYIDILQMKSKLYCPVCQGFLRPHIMFFDQFYQQQFNQSETVNNFLKDADCVLVIGTALQTGLAQSIVQEAVEKQKQVVEINLNCQIRRNAAWWIQGKSTQILEKINLSVQKK